MSINIQTIEKSLDNLLKDIHNLKKELTYYKTQYYSTKKENEELQKQILELNDKNNKLTNIMKNQEHLIRTLEKSSIKVNDNGTIIIPEESPNFKVAIQEVVKEILKDNYVTELIEKLNEKQDKLDDLEGNKNNTEEDSTEEVDDPQNQEDELSEEVFELFKKMWGETIENQNKKASDDFVNYLRKKEYTGKYKLGCLCSLNDPKNPVMWKIVGGNNKTVVLQHMVLSAKEQIEDIENVYPAISPDGSVEKEKFLNPNYKEDEDSKIIY